MKKVIFYSTLFIGGIIGLGSVLISTALSLNLRQRPLMFLFMLIFLAFIIWGMIGSLRNINKDDK